MFIRYLKRPLPLLRASGSERCAKHDFRCDASNRVLNLCGRSACADVYHLWASRSERLNAAFPFGLVANDQSRVLRVGDATQAKAATSGTRGTTATRP